MGTTDVNSILNAIYNKNYELALETVASNLQENDKEYLIKPKEIEKYFELLLVKAYLMLEMNNYEISSKICKSIINEKKITSSKI